MVNLGVLFMLIGAAAAAIMGNVIGVSVDFMYIGTLIGAAIGYFAGENVVVMYNGKSAYSDDEENERDE